jgi:acyl-CoA reductase-like NAD-dependent aldehyde dehydrogenase
MTDTMLTIHDPADGSLITTLPTADAEQVAAAAARARQAQPAWAAQPLAERLACIARFRAALLAELPQLALTLTRETGKPITQARNELNGLVGRIDFFLDAAPAVLATETVYDDGGLRERIERVPLGVVGNVSAWNYPWFVSCNVVLPALAAGNAVLFKPSEFATLSGQALVRLLHASGVPQDVLALLPGAGDTGAALVGQPLDGLFFTGSVATGQRIAAALAGRFVKLQLELGGKDPAYVRADADVAAAAASLADGAMYNAGQSCCAVERIYVQRAVAADFIAAFVGEVRALRLGDPRDEATTLGPLARGAQLALLDAQVDDALRRGARLELAGGRIAGRPGNWYRPVVLSGCDHDMQIMREESFGPVIGIQVVDGDDEAVALMNDSRYGLTAAVYSRDERAARALLARVQAGSAYWNCCDRVSPRLPWSGVRDSGIGLTLSREGIAAFTRPKAWHLRQPA